MALQDVLWLLVVGFGLRLVVMAARGRALPELLLGMALVLAGVGAPVTQRGLDTRDAELLFWAVVLITVSPAFTLSFVALVFRPAERWVWGWVAVLLGLLALGAWHQVAIVGLGSPEGFKHAPSALFMGVRALALGWCAYEALRYRRRYNKRLALGLADPVIANRFLLYGIWMGTMSALPLLMVVVTLVDPTGDSWRMVAGVPMRLTGLVVLVSMVLIFTPPRAYVRFIVNRFERRQVGATS